MDTSRLNLYISRSKWLLLVAAAIVLGMYWRMFDIGTLSNEAEAWGQFGDYIGGVMNPLIAFGAFFWLATSVQIQKIELAETRAALQGTQYAQQQQVAIAYTTVQIQTLNIRLSNVTRRVAQERDRLTHLYLHQGVHGPSAIYYSDNGRGSSVAQVIATVAARVAELNNDERALMQEIAAIPLHALAPFMQAEEADANV